MILRWRRSPFAPWTQDTIRLNARLGRAELKARTRCQLLAVAVVFCGVLLWFPWCCRGFLGAAPVVYCYLLHAPFCRGSDTPLLPPPQASVGALDFGVAVLKAPTQISFEVSNAGPVPCAWTATCPLVRRGVFSAC